MVKKEISTSRILEREKSWKMPVREVPPLEETMKEINKRMKKVEKEKEMVFKKIDELHDDAVELLRSLIRIPSVSGGAHATFEKELADYVAEKMKELGLQVEQIEPEPRRVSNLGRYKGKVGRPVLLFNSHLDTVPEGDLSAWECPPFEAVVHDGKIYGRGAKDCKIGIAASLLTVKAIKESNIELSGDILMSTTCDEEMGGHKGLHVLVDKNMIQADWAIYGEGLDPGETVMIGHKGMVDIEIITLGKSQHSSRKWLGVNAILKMCKVAPAIDAMTFTGWKPHPIVPGGPNPSVNIVEGGFKENVIPDRCKILVDIRTPPEFTIDQVLEQVNEVLERLKAEDTHAGGLQLEPLRLVSCARSSAIAPDEPIVKYIQAAAKEVLGFTPKPVGGTGTSDSRWLTLDANIPTAIFGMGNLSHHAPNEYVIIEDYIKNIKIYALLSLMMLK